VTVDLSPLDRQSRLLFEIPLKPLQGQRFQPTGFPNLGAATFKSMEGDCLLVESAQSMANRLEATIWDPVKQLPVSAVMGISHVRVLRKSNGVDKLLTDSMLEPHRLNSPYLLEGSDRGFFNIIKEALGAMGDGPIDRKKLAETLLKYDIGSLLHGVFLAKKELAGGRLRVARALTSFIEAKGVQIAASGGVKNDHVNPSGDTAKGFGNVPFSRDEFTADTITMFANVDLAQIRGYGLGKDVETLLILLALYKLRLLLDGDLRLRTACDFKVDETGIKSTPSFVLPDGPTLGKDVTTAIKAVNGADATNAAMVTTSILFNDELKKSKPGQAKKEESEPESEPEEKGQDA
jgi:CRISPR-associated protein Csb1